MKKQHIPIFTKHKHIGLKIMLFVMGAMIILFNVKGYEVLFHAEPLFPLIPVSPFGVLLGCAEIAVLMWTSAVIREWSISSRILKLSMFILVPAFWFLCYAGVNSYLDSLATQEIRKVEEAKKLNSNSEKYLTTLSKNVEKYEHQLNALRNEQTLINEQISEKNTKIQELNNQASARRLKVQDCSSVPDCASSVKAFEDQASRIANDISNLNLTRQNNQDRLSRLQDNLEKSQVEIDQRKLKSTENMNEYAGAESSFALKKAAYEKAIISVFSLFNITTENPFELFMMLVSGLVYPVYFLLNLIIALNSEDNKIAREKRLERKKIRQFLIRKIARYLRTRTLRKKKESLAKRQKQKSCREKLYRKMIRYTRVWAHRRKKTKIVEVEKIIEIPTEVEVEKIIEKKVPIEVEIEKIVEVEKVIEREIEVEKIVEVEKVIEKEVVVEVEKIVEVPTEVPVYVDKIKPVPEPMFIKDPQVIIHERIIPVPADITAKELEEIINAQPRLNTAKGDSVEASESSVESEPESDPQPESERDDKLRAAI